jgi:hypothetical protein
VKHPELAAQVQVQARRLYTGSVEWADDDASGADLFADGLVAQYHFAYPVAGVDAL